MAESIIINKDLSLEEQYKLLVSQAKSLLIKEDNILSNLANLTALLNQTFDKVSWAGFYFFDGEKLFLGPFQGNVACTNIELGKGVCGTSAIKKETIVVPDVNKFPGHIFCDVNSKSEIVIPIIKNDKLHSVLDLDSTELDAFNDIDKKYLEELVTFLSNEIIN